MKFVATVFALTILVPVAVAPSAAATFEFLESPTPATWANFALDDDGDILACNLAGEVYRWAADSGYQYLGPGHPLSSAISVSADGSTICTSRESGIDGYRNPVLWSEIEGWIDLGHTPNGCIVDDSWGSGFDLSDDGSVVVGLARCCAEAQAFRWTRQSGMVSLVAPVGGGAGRATAIADDGTAIVGFVEHPVLGFRRPVRWLPDGTPDLYAGNETKGEALATNRDGSIIVGTSVRHATDVAHYWSASDGLVHLGSLSGNPWDRSVATDIADDGTIYGHSHNSLLGITEAFVWTREAGMRRLQDVLLAAGADVPADIWLNGVYTVSGDGSRVVGSWRGLMFDEGYWLATFDDAGVAYLAGLRVTTDGAVAELSFQVDRESTLENLELVAHGESGAWNIPLEWRAGRLVGRDESIKRAGAAAVTYALYDTSHGRRQRLVSETIRIARSATATTPLAGTMLLPDRRRTTLYFTLDRRRHVRLAVRDANGHTIAHLADQSFPAGEHQVPWNGLDSGGRVVASEVCFIHLDIE